MLPAIDAGRRHPIVVIVLTLIAFGVLANAAQSGRLWAAVLYLGAVLVSAFVVDIVLARWPSRAQEPLVKDLRRELAVFGTFFTIGLAWLIARFMWNYTPPPGFVRLLFVAILFGCVFDGFSFVYLLLRRYAVPQIGFRSAGLTTAPFVIAIFATAGVLLRPAANTWAGIHQETGGDVLAIAGMALSAAVPEEFFRFLWQTRLAKLLGNDAVAWLFATALWAAMHMPKWWASSDSLLPVIGSALNIAPLGLLWGYLTHRTRTALPAMAVHASNIWGLQNLG